MRRLAVSLLVLGVSFACFQGCYGATEILVQIQTDVACSTVRKTGIAVRASGATSTLPDADVLASSTTCTDGTNGQLNDVGTLVFVPTSDTPQVSIRVVLGVNRPTDACDATSAGCITADRRITYEKHRTLHLPIRLDDACLGRVCAEGQTCSAGLCVSSVSACSGASCGSVEAADGSSPPVSVDPLPTDAGLADVVAVTPPDVDGGVVNVCPPHRAPDCGCKGLTPVCCYTETTRQCYATEQECAMNGVPAATYDCAVDCQCASIQETCKTATSCPLGVAKVCGGNCFQLK